MEFVDASTGQRRILGVKGDWKRNATLEIEGEVVAAVEKNKDLPKGVRPITPSRCSCDLMAAVLPPN